jgi:hypothetical protein
MGGSHIVRQGRNALFYKKPFDTEWETVQEYLVRLESDILKHWCLTAKDILARIQYEDEQLSALGDLLMDGTLISIQPGSSGMDLKRLDIIIEIFETVHLLRKKGHVINAAVLFQPLSGLWIEMDLAQWNGDVLDNYIRLVGCPKQPSQ